MANSKATLKFRTTHAVVIGLLVIANGCSLLPDWPGAVRSRSKVDCGTRTASSAIDEGAPHETASEESKSTSQNRLVIQTTPPAGTLQHSSEIDSKAKQNHTADDSTLISLALAQTETGQSDDAPELLLAPTTGEEPTVEVILAPNSDPTTPLQLQDVIASVHASYPLLEAALLSRSVAAGELLATRGEFDLKLKGGGTSGPFGFYRTNRFGAGASQPLFSGGEIFGGYKMGRGNFQPWFGERETNDGGEVRGGFAIPWRQNRQIDARRAAIFRATYGRNAVEPEIQTQNIAFVWEASYAYWQWVAAGRNYRIAQSLLEIAQQRNQGLKKRVGEGDLAPIELTDNKRLIVSRQATLIDAERKFQQSAIKLSLFLRTVEGRPVVPSEAQLPETFPKVIRIDSEQMASDIERAISNRPELVSLDLLRLQLGVDLAQARNLYLPAVDTVLVASKDIGEAASSTRDKTPFELEASLQISVPLQRRKARGKIQAIEGKLQQLSAKIGFTRDKITTDVQQVYAARLATYNRIVKARESLELARTMEQAERRKFDLGNSNLFLREQATADAAKNVVNALLDYFQAKADYRAAIALEHVPETG